MTKTYKCDAAGDDDDNLPIRLIIMVIIFPFILWSSWHEQTIELYLNANVLSTFVLFVENQPTFCVPNQ